MHSHSGHTHHGACNHHHGPVPSQNVSRAFVIGILLNAGFVAVEIIAGFYTGSLALLADAWHNLSDVLALALAWSAVLLARRRPTARYTYGLQSSSIIAALANAVLLLVVTGAMAWEALQRLGAPAPVAEETVMAVAFAGILVNGFTALLFLRGNRDDLNRRGAYLHMVADAGVSLGVVVSAALMMLTGWLWLDAAVSLLIAAVIVAGTWGLLRQSVILALHAVPDHINAGEVRAFLAASEGVREVHDLHIWAMSTTGAALSAHLLMERHPGDAFLQALSETLESRFRIQHATFQIELGDGGGTCKLASDEVV